MEAQKSETFRFLPKTWIRWGSNLAERISLFLVRMGLSPNIITGLALLAGMTAGLFFFLQRPFWAWLALFICGVLDTLDGKVAGLTNTKSAFGAILDSTLDRYSEFFVYLGLALHFRRHWALWLAFLALLGSTMASYTKARAEGLGFACNIGIMQRAERLICLGSGALLGSIFGIFDPAMITALALIALFSNMTAIQRIRSVKKAEQQSLSKREGAGHVHPFSSL
jgi:CDP-diacylglycerol--glycerol-3-phosphate 3-phosphatidyltransferase